jgi:phage replication-related protein YjqB (UPF0714/DUF867 family)
MQDRFASFAELERGAPEDSWRIVTEDKGPEVLVIAPHGGEIEVGTSELAASIAGAEHSLYCFEGRQRRAFRELHLTSHRFDEPLAVSLAARATIVVGVHGCRGQGAIYVGGLDIALVNLLTRSLREAGFPAHSQGHPFPALHPRNICNCSRRGAGAQLELTLDLRDAERHSDIAHAVRAAIAIHLQRLPAHESGMSPSRVAGARQR